jgi:hypothetical protein
MQRFLERDIAARLGCRSSTERRNYMPDTSSIIVRVVAGVLALVVLGIIIYRRKQKAKK